jgi:hypothetical protein
MTKIGNAINTALRAAAASNGASASNAVRILSASDSFKNDLKKLDEKFPKKQMPTQTTAAQTSRLAADNAFSLRRFSTSRPDRPPKGPFSQLASMYEGSVGKLRNYENARVTDAAEVVSWAADNDMLPKEASSIIDIGAAQGGAVMRLGKHYPDAAILALDTDPQSAAFISDKIKGNSELDNSERVSTFTGTLLEAFAEGKCKENSVSLVNMQAVAPYMSDEQLAQTLKGIHTALESGGKVVLSCYGEHHHLDESTGKKNLNLRTDYMMHDMLIEAGFTVECVGNQLSNERGQYGKTTKEMDDVLKQKNIPAHPEGTYWHTINIVATKN